MYMLNLFRVACMYMCSRLTSCDWITFWVLFSELIFPFIEVINYLLLFIYGDFPHLQWDGCWLTLTFGVFF